MTRINKLAALEDRLTVCPKCNGKLTYKGSSSTLVGYSSPTGHDHDDNCRTHEYLCDNGHHVAEKKQKVCSFPGCNGKGKPECFCGPFAVRVMDTKEEKL